MVVVVNMVVMVVRTGRDGTGRDGTQDRTGQDRTELTFKLDFPGNL